MSRAHSSTRGRLVALWKQNPHCYYCGQLTVLAPSGKKFIGPVPPNIATRDHVFSRLDPRRHDPSNPHRQKCVLSCYQCNFNRNEIEQNTLPKAIRQQLTEKTIRFVDGFVPFYPLTKEKTVV